MDYDVVIVGAGPAGLFAAWELKDSDLKTCVIDKGKAAKERERSEVTCGVGGAGTFSDGKLNLTSAIGGSPSTFNRTYSEIDEWIDKLDEIFIKFGAPQESDNIDQEKIKKLKKKANENGIEFIAGEQKHIGSDNVVGVIHDLHKHIEENGVDFKLEEEVHKIEENNGEFILNTQKDKIKCNYLITAPGRSGAYWLREQAQKLGAKNKFGPIDVGVRLEFPKEIYSDIKEVMYDAKFKLYTDTYDDPVRTFCTNPGGYISTEDLDDFVLINGHANDGDKSEYTNLALLNTIRLTNPVEDTTQYGRRIAKLATLIGGGKPLIQRFKDLRKGRRSTWNRIKRSDVDPTLKDATPGDISMALPSRIIKNIKEAIEKLDNLIPGIASDSTLIYAPEIKFYDTKYDVDKWLESTKDNLFIAGDASGHSRGIVFSGVTGMIAARRIKMKENEVDE